MIITVHGQAGSGKSTMAKLLAKKLGYRHYSLGEIRRQMAKERGLTIAQLNKLGEREDWTDKEPDSYMERMGRTQDNFVIDARMGFHFIPHSFKIYLKADPKVRAKRVYRDEREAEGFSSIKDAEKALVFRDRSDRARYEKYYRVDIMDMKNYDLVIDTSKLTREQVLERALAAIKQKLRI